MSQVLPRTYIIGIIVFCFFIVGGISWMANLGINSSQVEQFNATFDKSSDIIAVSNDLKSGVVDADTDFGVLGVLNGLISSAWNSLRLIFTSLGFMNDAFNAVSTMFGVPDWMPGLLIAAVVIILLFAIWSAVFQRDL